MTSEMKNLKKSIHQRLLNISRDKKEDFQLILIRFALERFLYRLSKSKYADQFILKGAFLFMVWTEQQHRPTRDLDFLCFGDSSAERLTRIFQEICCTEVEPDGLVFDVHCISLNEIREEQEYEGQRVKLMALLGKARI
ncbi:MAG: nucleotidyl transferase AbiEii/AbiGii toxin family protein, partial [Deltaproteobacteria bacterium]|nr:nucleotidyl transferase AbiEii/AbiGii toxin family protein [Deltaproteobacteria bacterium]